MSPQAPHGIRRKLRILNHARQSGLDFDEYRPGVCRYTDSESGSGYLPQLSAEWVSPFANLISG
jgi:hypothetical protein